MELMRYYDDRLSVVSHIFDYVKQLFRFLRGKHGGRLIEDEYIGAAVQDLDDLQSLFLRDRHAVHLLIGIHLKAVFSAYFFNPLLYLAQIVSSLFPDSERDILGGGEHIDKLEMLMDHSDSEVVGILRGTYGDFFSVNINMSGIRKIQSGKHIHKRCLAASVFTE